MTLPEPYYDRDCREDCTEHATCRQPTIANVPPTAPYYDRDGVTIYHGEALDILRRLAAGSVDILLTDPPYSSGGAFRSDQRTHAMWSALWVSETLRVCKPGAQAFVFTDWRQLPLVSDVMQVGGWTWRGIVVWDKGVGRPQRGKFRNHLEYILWCSHGAVDEVDAYPSTLIAVPTVGPNERVHVTQKPLRLLTHLMTLCPTSGVVLDPFMGSGSSLVSARELGYQTIGIEIEERYCDVAVKRLAQGVLDFGEATA